MTTFVLPLAGVGAQGLLSVLENAYVGLSKHPAKAADGAALVALACVLTALLKATTHAKVLQIPLRAAIHSVLLKAKEDCSRPTVDALVAALKTALSHIRRLCLNDAKNRQAGRWLSVEDRDTLDKLCELAGGAPSMPRNTLYTLFQAGSAKRKPAETDSFPVDGAWDPEAFARAASKPGGLRAIAACAEPVQEVQGGGKKRKVEEPAVVETPIVEPPADVPEPTLSTPVKAAKRSAKFASPKLGRVTLSLGALRSEVCYFPEGTQARSHLMTFHGVPAHRELAAAIVQLACSTEATASELKAIGKAKLDQLRALEQPV